MAAGLATGFSFRMTDDSPLTLGMGVFGLVGGGVNFAGKLPDADPDPRQPPKNFGVGPIYSNLSILGINPMASYQVTDKLAIGGGPIITVGTPSFNPAFFARGRVARSGCRRFPRRPTHAHTGAAVSRLGLLYKLNSNWNLGFSYKSPIWQEKWDFNASYPQPGSANHRDPGPAAADALLGRGLQGLPKTLIDVNLRYIDYANTSLFGTKVIDGGLGWRSVFVVALGAQYQATDRLTFRGGYLYNTNPIRVGRPSSTSRRRGSSRTRSRSVPRTRSTTT